MTYNEQGKRTSLENLAGVLKSSTRYTRLKQNMKRIVVFCPPEGVACGAFAGALDQACWASRPLDLYPELERIETVGRRAVEWYAHDASPAWGGRGYRVATVLEYPHFLTPEMSRMPDFIGRDEFLEVK